MYKFDGNSEELLVKFSYGVIFGVIERIIFGLTESPKLGEDIGCKEGVSLGLFEWNIERIIEGTMIGCFEGFI